MQLRSVLIAVTAISCGGGSGSPGAAFHDCDVSGSVTAMLPAGGESASFTRCQAYVGNLGDPKTVALDLYDFNNGTWEEGNLLTMVFRFSDAKYSDTTFDIVGYSQDWNSQAPGTVSIQYTDNAHPRQSFGSNAGGTLTLAGPLLLPDPGANTVSLAATGQMLAGAATVTFMANVSVTTVPNLCHPYAQSIVNLATQAGCAGAGMSASDLEMKCNMFVGEYVERASCAASYEAYLDCASKATTCDPCRPEYCAFDACMCQFWSPASGACADPVTLGCM